jgi:RNA polymerase sigma-54 factor
LGEVRRKTILRVCEYLAEAQKDFLERGDTAIKPLLLKDVAGALSISEATVSRVVSNKYAQFVNRLIALKSFFARKIKTVDGKFVSDRGIKQEIQDLIEEEDPRRPLSDETIAAIMNKKGIKISRRTIAKYREALGILSSYARREQRSNPVSPPDCQ